MYIFCKVSTMWHLMWLGLYMYWWRIELVVTNVMLGSSVSSRYAEAENIQHGTKVSFASHRALCQLSQAASWNWQVDGLTQVSNCVLNIYPFLLYFFYDETIFSLLLFVINWHQLITQKTRLISSLPCCHVLTLLDLVWYTSNINKLIGNCWRSENFWSCHLGLQTWKSFHWKNGR